MKRKFPLLLLCCLAVLPARAQQVQLFDDPEAWDHPEQSPADSAPIRDSEGSGGFRNLTYYYAGRLNDGMAFTCILFHWLSGPFGGWRLVVLVQDSDGRPHQYQRSIAERSLEEAADIFQVRFPGGLFTEDEQGQLIWLELPGFSCRLRLRRLLPSWKPGDGLAVLDPSGEVFIRLAVPLPWAEVEGEMAIEGRPFPVRGQMYADQSLAVLPMNRQNSPAYSFRGFSPDGASEGERWMIGIHVTTTHPSYGSRPLPILLAAHDGSWVLTSRDFSLELRGFGVEPRTGMRYPTSAAVRVERDGWLIEGEITDARQYWLTDIFQELPAFIRSLAELFLKRPVILRYTGRFRGTARAPDGSLYALSLTGLGECMELR
jgi:hypothetical protein